MTNYERIKRMNAEEMAKTIRRIRNTDDICSCCSDKICETKGVCNMKSEFWAIMDWLNAEVEE